MNPIPPALCVVFALAATAALPAQLPPHATRLDPTVVFAVPPTIVQTGDVVHAVSMPSTTGWLTTYGRSADGGRSWLVLEQALGPFRLGNVAAHGGTIAVAGWSQVPTPWVAVSSDLGQTWSAQQVSASALTWVGSAPEIVVHVDGQSIVVVWMDLGNGRLLARRSPDGGATWPGGDVVLSQSPGPLWTSFSRTQLQLVGDGAAVHVFWLDVSPNGLVQAQQSSFDAGATWLPAPRTIPLVASSSLWWPVTVAGSATDLLLASVDNQLRRSTNGGATWTPVSGLGIDVLSSFAVDGQVAVAVGTVAPATPPTWVVNVSTDMGQTWQSNPLTLQSFPGFSGYAHAVGATVYAFFPNGLQPAASVVAVSHDLGTTWRALQYNVHAFAPGPRRTIHLQRPAGGGTYAFVGLGCSLRGAGTAGSGGAVPALAMQGLPALGQTTSFAVDAAVGGTIGVLAIASQPPFPIPFAGGTFWPSGPLATSVLLTGGTTGAPGAGSWSLPVVVPNTPALAGASLTGQAVLLDPAGTAGLVLTNAIEVWVR